MTNKLQCISYLIFISIFIDQGDGRWKDREKEELRKDFVAYKKFKDKLQRHIEEFYEHRPFLFTNEMSQYGPYSKDIELDFLKEALMKPKNYTRKMTINIKTNTQHEQNHHIIKPTNEKMDEVLKKSSKSKTQSEYISSNPGWPKFEDLLRTIGKKYDWKNDRWIKLKKNELTTRNEDENAIHYHVKHEFKYKLLKANKENKKRKNVVVVTAVR